MAHHTTNAIGALVIDLANHDLTPEEKELLQHPQVGGVILFKRNYLNKKQLSALCHSVRKVAKSPILLFVDQEGGRVQRFTHEFTKLPAMQEIGICAKQNLQAGKSWAEQVGSTIAKELIDVGIDMSFAPVLDVNLLQSSVIGDRAFSDEISIVSELGLALMHGMNANGMASTAKHFPGHGGVTLDSHHEMPVDERNLDTLRELDLIPFQHLIKNGLQAIMTCHINFPNIDSKPVTYSYVWLQKILRKMLRFTGTIFSDDLNMKAAHYYESPVDRFNQARYAGCDFGIFCNDRASVIKILDAFTQRPETVDAVRWLPLHASKLYASL